MQSVTFRDLTILSFTQEKSLVIACDSSAGIGEKENDQVKIAPEIMAAYCLRVPLLELFCFGAVPISLVDLIGNEFEPTGQQMLAGIKEELKKADLEQLSLNGSTEENMTTKTSSIGITVIGEIEGSYAIPQISSEAALFQLGEPYVADEVVANLNKIFSYDLVRELKQETGVLDMIPVGSKGIQYEAESMAATSEKQVKFFTTNKLQQSAGPATVVLLAIQKSEIHRTAKKYPMLKQIGEFY